VTIRLPSVWLTIQFSMTGQNTLKLIDTSLRKRLQVES
jgi:hypothetical protein